MHKKRFPNESPLYREKRFELLKAEISLKEQVESVAKMRRELPLGGELKEDYLFSQIKTESTEPIKFSDLFEPGKDTLIVYTYMFADDWQSPCPMCTSILDGFNGVGQHVSDRVNFAVICKASTEKLKDVSQNRGWDNFKILSSSDNDFLKDYHSDYKQENHPDLHPLIHVFTKTDEKIFHFWTSEMIYGEFQGQPRHADMVWPLWNLFDMTPEGRGTDWYPKLEY